MSVLNSQHLTHLNPMNTLRIATRQSPLALWQASFVKQELERCWPKLEVHLVPMLTSGDRFLSDSLATVGGKGLFVKELERALLEGTADVAVHSLKDVPAHLPEGLVLSVFLEREDPRDALLSSFASLETLPYGARVGTASLRRCALLKHYYPHLCIETLRGNVNSRLTKLENGDFDAILLAVAGLKRLGLETQIRQYLELENFVPAVGQGVLALQCRTADTHIATLLAPLHHTETALCVTAERAFNERLGGACHVPVAAHATIEGSQLQLNGLVASVDGQACLRTTASAPFEHAIRLGIEVAETLLARGAAAILSRYT